MLRHLRIWAGSSLIALCASLAVACGGGSSGAPGDEGGGSSTPGGSNGASSGSSSGKGSNGTSSRSSGSSVATSGSGASATGASTSGSHASTASGSSSASSSSGTTTTTTTGCGAGDTNLPAEPTIPAACTTLTASLAVASGGVPSESAMDTTRLQSALNACTSGQAVRLVASGSNNAFITGPITIPANVSLWVDTGATLYGTRSTSIYGSASALITVHGANSGIVGGGTIDGQGGEPIIGGTGSFWDQNGNGGSSPALIQVSGATNFTLFEITLQNSPMFHVKLDAAGFVVWGITINTPSKTKNSVGTALSATTAHNTDGVDPGEAASNGFIVCNKISDGDDHIAIKGSSTTGVKNLTIAHNHFGAGHGMSIGSEFTGGVSDINVYDLSIDGTVGNTESGIRIKSDSSRGGLVNNVTYSDVCVRDVTNVILLTPLYSTATGSRHSAVHEHQDPELPRSVGEHSQGDARRLRLVAPEQRDARQRRRRRHHVVRRERRVHERDAGAGRGELHAHRHRRDGHELGLRHEHAERVHQQVGHVLSEASFSGASPHARFARPPKPLPRLS